MRSLQVVMLMLCVLGGLFLLVRAPEFFLPAQWDPSIGRSFDPLASRLLGAGLEKELAQPVNVVNRTGGGGVTGHSAMMTAAADGYTIGLATSEIATYKAIGLADITPDNFDIISRVTTIPSGITVKADGPYKTAADVIAALKAAPKGTLSASGTGPGGAWHLALAGLCKAAGLAADHVKYIPSQGGAPALQELVAGGLEPGKLVRVLGLADTAHLNPDDPLDPANRRISIVVLNKAAEEAMRAPGRQIEVEGAGAPGAREPDGGDAVVSDIFGAPLR